LAGDRFGGSSNHDNLVSQSSNINLSQYKKIENHWARSIGAGKKVQVHVEIEYNDNNMRPSIFNIKYEINDEVFKISLKN
jgi:hypothetical protein